MNVYQDVLGKWIVFDGVAKHHFDTQLEALQMTSKVQLAEAIIFQTQLHARPMDEGADVLQEYFDSGITFSDEDVAPLGVTAAEVVTCLTLLENAAKFYSGSTPANAIYRTTVNSVRRVSTGG